MADKKIDLTGSIELTKLPKGYSGVVEFENGEIKGGILCFPNGVVLGYSPSEKAQIVGYRGVRVINYIGTKGQGGSGIGLSLTNQLVDGVSGDYEVKFISDSKGALSIDWKVSGELEFLKKSGLYINNSPAIQVRAGISPGMEGHVLITANDVANHFEISKDISKYFKNVDDVLIQTDKQYQPIQKTEQNINNSNHNSFQPKHENTITDYDFDSSIVDLAKTECEYIFNGSYPCLNQLSEDKKQLEEKWKNLNNKFNECLDTQKTYDCFPIQKERDTIKIFGTRAIEEKYAQCSMDLDKKITQCTNDRMYGHLVKHCSSVWNWLTDDRCNLLNPENSEKTPKNGNHTSYNNDTLEGKNSGNSSQLSIDDIVSALNPFTVSSVYADELSPMSPPGHDELGDMSKNSNGEDRSDISAVDLETVADGKFGLSESEIGEFKLQVHH